MNDERIIRDNKIAIEWLYDIMKLCNHVCDHDGLGTETSVLTLHQRLIALSKGIKALKTINKIREIINPTDPLLQNIQEDVIRYKMICEVLDNAKRK